MVGFIEMMRLKGNVFSQIEYNIGMRSWLTIVLTAGFIFGIIWAITGVTHLIFGSFFFGQNILVVLAFFLLACIGVIKGFFKNKGPVEKDDYITFISMGLAILLVILTEQEGIATMHEQLLVDEPPPEEFKEKVLGTRVGGRGQAVLGMLAGIALLFIAVVKYYEAIALSIASIMIVYPLVRLYMHRN